MRLVNKVVTAAVLCAALYAVLAEGAVANRLGISESRRRIAFDPLSIVPAFGSTVRCHVTLEQTYHSRTLTKSSGSLAGYIARAEVGVCDAGRMRVHTETLPWHRTHVDYRGLLPNITSVSEGLLGARVETQGEIFGLRVTCGYEIRSGTLIYMRESRGVITEERPGTERFPSLTGGCPEIQFSGVGSVRTPGGGSITMSLV
jgi:hypothetical protein